jgi:hypothetical protein
MGEEGAIYPYYEDSYLIAEQAKMAEVLAHAPSIFGMVGLRIGLDQDIQSWCSRRAT